MAPRSRSASWLRTVADAKLFRWPVLALLVVFAFGLGYHGFGQTCAVPEALSIPIPRARMCEPLPSAADQAYLSLQLFVWQSGAIVQGREVPPTLQVARFLAPTAFGIAAVCAFMALFADRVGAVRARFRRGHVIVCGLGDRGLAMARRLRESGEIVVQVDVLEPRTGPRSAHSVGAVIVGDATNPTVLRRAGIMGARHLVAVCGDDGLNAEVAARAAAETAGTRHVLTCHAHVATPALWERLRAREVASTRDGTSRLQFFSTVNLAARAVVGVALPPADDAAPHLVVAGSGAVAERSIVRAALAWREMKDAARLRITVADTAAATRVAALGAAYPRMADGCDVVPCEFDPAAPGPVERLLALLERTTPVSTVCLTGLDDARLLAWALGVLHATADAAFPIVVAAAREEGLNLLAMDAGDGGRRLRIVGSLERGCTAEAVLGGTHELLARAIHAEYIRDRARAGQSIATNPSMQPWSTLPEVLRESNRRQADDLAAKVESVGAHLVLQSEWDPPVFTFTADEVERLAEREHIRWINERQQADWSYDPHRKGVAEERSPHLIPWAKLTKDIQDIDRNTVRHIPQFLARVGLGIRRNASPAPSAKSSPRS